MALRLPTQVFESLDVVQQDAFIDRLKAFLLEEQLIADDVPEDPYRYVDALVCNAERLGLRSELGVAKYAILASLFGDKLQGISDQSWFSALQRDEPPDPDWID